MRYLQAIADQLHDNYYEDWLGEALATNLIADVNSLIPLLWEARERGPNPDFTPAPRLSQRTIDRLLLLGSRGPCRRNHRLATADAAFNPPTR